MMDNQLTMSSQSNTTAERVGVTLKQANRRVPSWSTDVLYLGLVPPVPGSGPSTSRRVQKKMVRMIKRLGQGIHIGEDSWGRVWLEKVPGVTWSPSTWGIQEAF